jgi:sulfatase modifying factor 1
MSRLPELRGLAVVLAMAGVLGGALACGGVADQDTVGAGSGGPDGMPDSPADVAAEAGNPSERDATLDSSEDVVPRDASIEASLVAVAEAGDAGGAHAPSDSAGDVAVADVTLDAPGTDAEDAGAPGTGAEDGGAVDAGSDAPSCPEAGDSGAEAPSCAAGGPGMTNCGPGGSGTESCCTSLEVCGGTFYRQYDNDGGGPASEAKPATVSSFRLDKYLVTVGRFRQFVRAWNGGYNPPAGSGKHIHLNGGEGLENAWVPGAYEPGWNATWNDDPDVDAADSPVACVGSQHTFTWTNSPGTQENLPIDCVNWYEAYAFCIWDGGFLPSGAEWEYAAAGGSQQREYPWGSTAPGTGGQRAVYEGEYMGNTTQVAPVGYASLGAGLWGQFDLAGGLEEWLLDMDFTYVDPCTDCAAVTVPQPNSPGTDPARLTGGGGFSERTTTQSVTAGVESGSPARRSSLSGLRCARAP